MVSLAPLQKKNVYLCWCLAVQTVSALFAVVGDVKKVLVLCVE